MKSELRKCKWCNEQIPPHEHGLARYCSNEHYELAKKSRSQKRYQDISEFTKELKRNEDILNRFYLMVELQFPVTFENLDNKKFNWGISQGETVGLGNRRGVVIGRYAYHLDTRTKNVIIWKLKSGQ
jgi:hypothetical protein